MKAAIYIRVSTEEQATEGYSVPAQKERLTSFCISQKWDIFDYYIDDGYSGKDLNRPNMQRLIKDINNKKIDVVVVYKLDRMSRKQKDALYFIEDVLETNKVGFKSITENFDTTTPFGKAALGMSALFAQLERETIIERTKMGKKEVSRQGKWNHGHAPYGYKFNSDKKILEISENEAQVVNLIFTLYINQSMGFRSIADYLNNKKIASPTGKQWAMATIRYILTNETYLGVLKHRDKVYSGLHQPIVREDIFNATQKEYAKRVQNQSRKHSRNFLLTGVLYCGECGAKMRGKMQKNSWNDSYTGYYVCRTQDGYTKHLKTRETCDCGYKRIEFINSIVIEKIKRLSLADSDIKEVIKKELSYMNDGRKRLEKLIKQNEQRISDINKKLNKWYDLFERDTIEADELTDRVHALREQKKELEVAIQTAQKQLEHEKDNKEQVDLWTKTIKQFNKIFDKATFEEKRTFIKYLIKKITVYKDNTVNVEYYLPTCFK